MRDKLIYGLVLLLLFSCEKWYDTADVSHISFLPEFTMEGGDFVSFLQNDTMEYTDPGATAFSGDKELTVYAFGEVDLSRAGLYVIVYYAQNEDKLIEMDQRLIAVRYEDVKDNDLSGTYTGTLWDPVETKVKKVHEDGLYECTEVLGFPDREMRGRFVDLGDNELRLVNGEGYFGRYAASEGSYSLSTLSWTIAFVDPPNEGVELQVLWRKQE